MHIDWDKVFQMDFLLLLRVFFCFFIRCVICLSLAIRLNGQNSKKVINIDIAVNLNNPFFDLTLNSPIFQV